MKRFEEVVEVEVIKIKDRVLPSVSLGTSPFIGAGQFKQAYNYYQTFTHHPEKMVEIILMAIQLGIPSVQVLPYKPIISALLEAERRAQVEVAKTFTIGLSDWRKELELAIPLNPIIIFLHAQIADSRNFSLIIGYLMGREPEKVLKIVEETKKIVLAKKVLGAGRIPPDEAFSYIMRMPKIKGIIVGIASKKEAEETFSLAKKYWRRRQRLCGVE